VAVAEDRVIAAAAPLPWGIVDHHHLARHGSLQPQLQPLAFVDQEIIDEQLAPVADVERFRLVRDLSRAGGRPENSEQTGDLQGAKSSRSHGSSFRMK